MKREYKVEGFSSFDDALKSQAFDAVVICTPANTHIGLARIALRAGAALLIEKPLSTNLELIDEFKLEVEKAKRYVAIAYVYHSVPAFSAAKKFLEEGKLGKPLQVSVVAGQHFPTFRPAYREIYYTRHETGGGAIQDALTHLVNTVEWFVGPTDRISCEARHQLLEGVEVEDTVSASASNGDVLVTYCLNQFQVPNEMVFLIHCAAGSLAIEVHNQRWGHFLRGAPGWEFHPAPVAQRDDLYLNQVHAFLDGLEGKPDSLCTLEEAIQTLKVNLAALESARTGQPVKIL
jgi:predicted dehydrogenase